MPQWEYCTLTNDQSNIYYALYQENGIQAEQRLFDVDVWASSIALLGSMRWEAITATDTPESDTWHFKRPIQPGNMYFTLSTETHDNH